jgi:hypothetical protein
LNHPYLLISSFLYPLAVAAKVLRSWLEVWSIFVIFVIGKYVIVIVVFTSSLIGNWE